MTLKTNEFDYLLLLFDSIFRPESAINEFLEKGREKSGYSKEAFLGELKQSFELLIDLYSKSKADAFRGITNEIDFENIGYSMPMYFLEGRPYFEDLLSKYGTDQKITKMLLDGLDSIINEYSIYISKSNTSNNSNESEEKGFENKFNSMTIEQVRDHFKRLIEKENPKGSIWMTKEDFEIFLKRSFGKQIEIPKPKINIGYGGKYAIVKLFYQFYDYCQKESLTENRNKDPFIDLLKNAFETKDFENLTNENFKGNLNKYEWTQENF